jgi:arylsulfatase A-like enzyme
VAPPNVVFILADDMGYGDMSHFNGGLSSTPVLDQLCREGTVLAQHYSSSPVCAPARASFLTGRYPHRTGAFDTLEGRGLDRLRLDELTVADVLTEAGYATGLVGKGHNGCLDPRYHPNRRGFAEFAGFSGGWSDYWNWRMDRNGSESGSDGRYLTEVLTDEAVAFVRRHAGEPFFLHLAYSAPHYPLQVPDEEVAPFLQTGRFTPAVARIYAMIAVMDRGIGRVLQTLSDLGLQDNTLVVFSSDNGPQFGGEGEHCMDRFNHGYRGSKLFVYEGGIRLPAVLRWPAGLPALGEVGGLVHFTDWFPTIAAAAEARPVRAAGTGSVGDEAVTSPATPQSPKALDGVDVLALLRGQACETPPVRFWQWNRYTPIGETNAAMRDGAWKLVRPAVAAALEVSAADLAMDVELKYRPGAHTAIVDDPLPEVDLGPLPPSQLYNLDADPGEETDLAAAQPGRVSRMESELGRWFEDVMA